MSIFEEYGAFNCNNYLHTQINLEVPKLFRMISFWTYFSCLKFQEIFALYEALVVCFI